MFTVQYQQVQIECKTHQVGVVPNRAMLATFLRKEADLGAYPATLIEKVLQDVLGTERVYLSTQLESNGGLVIVTPLDEKEAKETKLAIPAPGEEYKFITVMEELSEASIEPVELRPLLEQALKDHTAKQITQAQLDAIIVKLDIEDAELDNGLKGKHFATNGIHFVPADFDVEEFDEEDDDVGVTFFVKDGVVRVSGELYDRVVEKPANLTLLTEAERTMLTNVLLDESLLLDA